ncbi:MAG: hypothetical protein WEB78_06030 [Ilumatobacteraceae bacterium]
MKRRTTVLISVAVLITSGGAYLGHRIADGGKITEVGVNEALDRYREQTATTPSAPPDTASPGTVQAATTTAAAPVTVSLPAPGVYQYATTGFDQIDALTGARHDYPAVTTITVVPYGCGVRLRWDIAVERWDSWDWCLDNNAIRQTGLVGYHEFFGTSGRNDNTCSGDPRPLDASPGTTWTMRCHMGDRTTSTFTGTVIERTTRSVAGTTIPVLHLRYEVDVTGESTGSQTVEGWYRSTDGLPVREQLTITTKQDTVIGTTNFDETYTIDLMTPVPAA